MKQDRVPNSACERAGGMRSCCPLSQVRSGTSVRIKQLLAAPELCQRLRELGFCEEKKVRCLLQSRSVVCEVCNVRLGLCARLADSIWVEPIAGRQEAA
ncbi:MAG: ferrous iron transport protein A [Verrucomicrobiae bacterium]|nr:ferrous iron transport protein A [Verrucomicrobiae bacterium]MCP5516337.1 ferrous iron transport protein A [Verrucomicrobiales bacterium]